MPIILIQVIPRVKPKDIAKIDVQVRWLNGLRGWEETTVSTQLSIADNQLQWLFEKIPSLCDEPVKFIYQNDIFNSKIKSLEIHSISLHFSKKKNNVSVSAVFDSQTSFNCEIEKTSLKLITDTLDDFSIKTS